MFGNCEIPRSSEMCSNMGCDNDRREIYFIKESLEYFIEECKVFNSSIDDSTTRAEVLQCHYSGIHSRFDDIYPLLNKIPNALVAFKLQLSMETLLDKAKRVFIFEVEPTLKRAQEIKKLRYFLPNQISDCSKPLDELQNTYHGTYDKDGTHLNLVPVFSGDISEFCTFKEAFDRIFHNTDLANSFKFSALKSRLTGPLLNAVSKFGEDYNAAYKSLIWQHAATNNKARSKLDAFLLIPGFNSISSNEIEKYRLCITEAHRDLIELHLPDLGDYILYVFAFNRMPDALREEFLEVVKPFDVPSLQQLLNFLFEQETALKTLEQEDSPVSACDGSKTYVFAVGGTGRAVSRPSESDSVGAVNTTGSSLSLPSQKTCYNSSSFRAIDEEESVSTSNWNVPGKRVLPSPGTDPTESKPGSRCGDPKVVNGRSSSQSSQKPCHVCRGSHSMQDCSTFQTNDNEDSFVSSSGWDGPGKPVSPSTATGKADSKPRRSDSGGNKGSSSESSLLPCHVCSEHHSMRNCPIFRALTVAERRSYMERFDQICRNCLAQWHHTSNCHSLNSCKLCSKRHNILLHPLPHPKHLTREIIEDTRLKKLRDIRREIGMFRRAKSPSPVASSDEFLLSSPSSDS